MTSFAISGLAENDFIIMSASVENGAANVGICPTFVYTFSEVVSETSLDSVILIPSDNPSDAVAIRAKTLSDDNTTVTLRLGEELLYNTQYTLNLAGVTSTDSQNTLGSNITFTTKDGVNEGSNKWIFEDNFETGVYNTVKWRDNSPNNNPPVVIAPKPSDPSNYALQLLDNNPNKLQIYPASKYISIKDVAVVEFSLNIYETNSGKCGMPKFNGSEINFLSIDRSKDGGMVKCLTKGGEYVDFITNSINVWTHYKFVIDLNNNQYTVYAKKDNDATLYSGMFSLDDGFFTSNILSTINFQIYNPGLYLDDVSIRPLNISDYIPGKSAPVLISASVADKSTDISLSPKLVYTFDKAVNITDYIPMLSNYTAEITPFLSADSKTLTLKLGRKLKSNTEYTLNLGEVEDAQSGVPSGNNITFTTEKNLYIVEEDFEYGIDANPAYGATGDWRANPENIVDDYTANKVYRLKYEGTTQLLANTNASNVGRNYSGDYVLEFRFKISEIGPGGTLLSLFADDDPNTTDINGEHSVLFVAANDDSSYKLQLTDGSNGGTTGNRVTAATYNYNDWHKCTLVVNPTEKNYKCYLDDVPVGDTYDLWKDIYYDKIVAFRFQASSGSPKEYYIDDIKIARKMWLEDGGFYNADGEKINIIDPADTVYKAQFISHGPADEKLTLYLARYSSDGKVLKDIVISPMTIPAGKRIDFNYHFYNLNDEAYNSKIKAIYVNNNSALKPFRESFGMNSVEVNAGTAPIDVTATLLPGETVTPVYPGGLYKAVTMRFDDGKIGDKAVLDIMNENGLKGTFYLIANTVKNGNSASNITAADVKTVYAGHEVGNHSMDHVVANVSLESLKASREYLESVWGSDVIGFAYPDSTYGTHGEATYKNWLKESGHVYANMACVWNRNVTTTVLSDVVNTDDIYETTNSCRMKYTDFDNATKAYAANTDKKQSLLFTMQHASDFFTDGVFDPQIMNTFVANIANRDDIWYCTNGEVITYLIAQNKMNVPSSGSSITVNNTDKTLYYMVGDELVCIEPGSRLIIES